MKDEPAVGFVNFLVFEIYKSIMNHPVSKFEKFCLVCSYCAAFFIFIFTCYLPSVYASDVINLPSVGKFLDDPLGVESTTASEQSTVAGYKIPLCPPKIDFHKPLVLDDALDLALCNHPKIAEAWAQVKIEVAGLGVSKSAYLPTINASVGRLNNRTTYLGVEGDLGTRTSGTQINSSLSWRLFDFGGRSANLQSSDQLLIAAFAGHNLMMQSVMINVIQAYFDAITKQAIYEARVEMINFAKNTMEATQRKELRGASAVNETLQSAAALAKSQLIGMRADADFKKSLNILKSVIGIPLTTEISLPAQFGAGFIFDKSRDMSKVKDYVILQASELDLEKFLLAAESRHPSIIQAKAKWEADKHKVAVARSEGLPTVDAAVNFYRNGYPNQPLSSMNQQVVAFGVTVNIPIFEGFGRVYKINNFQAIAEQSQLQLEFTTQQIMLDVVKAHADALASLKTYRASEQLLKAAYMSVESSRRRYQHGAADIVELLNAESGFADAQQEHIRADAEYRASTLILLANTGSLDKLDQFSALGK